MIRKPSPLFCEYMSVRTQQRQTAKRVSTISEGPYALVPLKHSDLWFESTDIPPNNSISNSMEHSSSLKAKSLTLSLDSPALIAPDGSVLCSHGYFNINFNISPHLLLGLRSGLFPLGFPTKTLYAFSPLPCVLPCPDHLISWCKDPNNIWWSSSLNSLLLHSSFFSSLTSKYSQHSILKHPPFMFFR
jgi:hypothetical protein